MSSPAIIPGVALALGLATASPAPPLQPQAPAAGVVAVQEDLASAVITITHEGPGAQAPVISCTEIVDGQISIFGSGFGPAPVVTIGGKEAWVVETKADRVLARVPSLDAGIHVLRIAPAADAPEEVTISTTVTIQ